MKKENIENNTILKLTFDFSLSIITYCDKLNADKRFQLSKQLFRSGTSIGANAYEAQNAESKADFIHKFKIASKEIDETQYWLLLCKHLPGFPECEKLLSDLDQIDKIMTKIISTSKRKIPVQ